MLTSFPMFLPTSVALRPTIRPETSFQQDIPLYYTRSPAARMGLSAELTLNDPNNLSSEDYSGIFIASNGPSNRSQHVGANNRNSNDPNTSIRNPKMGFYFNSANPWSSLEDAMYKDEVNDLLLNEHQLEHLLVSLATPLDKQGYVNAASSLAAAAASSSSMSANVSSNNQSGIPTNTLSMTRASYTPRNTNQTPNQPSSTGNGSVGSPSTHDPQQLINTPLNQLITRRRIDLSGPTTPTATVDSSPATTINNTGVLNSDIQATPPPLIPYGLMRSRQLMVQQHVLETPSASRIVEEDSNASETRTPNASESIGNTISEGNQVLEYIFARNELVSPSLEPPGPSIPTVSNRLIHESEIFFSSSDASSNNNAHNNNESINDLSSDMDDSIGEELRRNMNTSISMSTPTTNNINDNITEDDSDVEMEID